MRIAFDVKGTLAGHNQVKVRELFKRLHDAGHKVYVWSNLWSYAWDMANELKALGFSTEALDKFGEYDEMKVEANEGPFDVAIEDDTSQTWLAAKRLVFVHTIEDVEATFKEITNG